MKKTIAQTLKVKEFPFIINDSNNNQIYRESSNGFWYKSEYDSNGNEIYCENSYGDWSKGEFDSNGNLIYFEDSEGNIEDNRNIPEYTMQDIVDRIGRFKFKR